MRGFVIMLWLVLVPGSGAAQSSIVLPEELTLSVQVEDTGHTPVLREMVMITIRGIYRRHITLEALIQPDLDGFNWSQLGPDSWREERLEGKRVKIFERRMALYPNRTGPLTIGAFRHQLTLTDEGDDWFEHVIQSDPVQIIVDPPPGNAAWFFPVRDLRISDQWSNAPDQLAPGEGVLRVVRLEALGVTPEMIPPMPELVSPSAVIFPHPEKRLVELTPDGPMTYAFWRWTIRPSNDVSTIVEPLQFRYFNTTDRQSHEVTIGAQRIAYGVISPQRVVPPDRAAPMALPGPWVMMASAAVFAGGLWWGLLGLRVERRPWPAMLRTFDPLVRQLRRAAREGSATQTRRQAAALIRRDGATIGRQKQMRQLDQALFGKGVKHPDLKNFVRQFLRG